MSEHKYELINIIEEDCKKDLQIFIKFDMMENKKHLVIGFGEIGKPIFNILKEHYNVESYDKGTGVENPYFKEKFDVLHTCFGHKDNEVEEFKKWVREYQDKFLKEDGLTIVHSTTAVGVCDDLGVVHSPIIGQHDRMEEYIRKATKIFGGKRSQEAAEVFRRMGIKVLVFDRAKESEAAKLFLTECYRVNIEFCQRVKRFCEKSGLEFNNVYTLPAMIYNQAYKDMGHDEYIRQVLVPNLNDIGGHCVKPNEKLVNLSE